MHLNGEREESITNWESTKINLSFK